MSIKVTSIERRMMGDCSAEAGVCFDDGRRFYMRDERFNALVTYVLSHPEEFFIPVRPPAPLSREELAARFLVALLSIDDQVSLDHAIKHAFNIANEFISVRDITEERK